MITNFTNCSTVCSYPFWQTALHLTLSLSFDGSVDRPVSHDNSRLTAITSFLFVRLLSHPENKPLNSALEQLTEWTTASPYSRFLRDSKKDNEMQRASHCRTRGGNKGHSGRVGQHIYVSVGGHKYWFNHFNVSNSFFLKIFCFVFNDLNSLLCIGITSVHRNHFCASELCSHIVKTHVLHVFVAKAGSTTPLHSTAAVASATSK